MLDLPPTYKYERPFGKSGEGAKIRTGASFPRLFEACRLCRVPARAMMDLLNWTLFQLLIGNSDAHAKNISCFVVKSGIDVAPGYDLLNIDMYGDEFERYLGMAIGDEFKAEEIMAYDLALFCGECRLPQRQVATSLKNLCKAVLENLGSLPMDDVQPGGEMDFAQDLIRRVTSEVERFLDIAKELPQVKL
jgi:serine/threonine-protein kinase HipA